MQLKTLLQKLFCCISINTSLFGMKNEEQSKENFDKEKRKEDLYKEFMEADHAKRVAMIWKHNVWTKNKGIYKNSEFYYHGKPVTVYFEIFTSSISEELFKKWLPRLQHPEIEYSDLSRFPSKIIKDYNSLLQQDNKDLSQILRLYQIQMECAKQFLKKIIGFAETEEELIKAREIYDNATLSAKKPLEPVLEIIQDVLQAKQSFVENTSIESKEDIFDSIKTIYDLEGKKFELSEQQEKAINAYLKFMQRTNKDLDNLKEKEWETMNLMSDFREKNSIYVEYADVYKIHINDLKDKEGKVATINNRNDLEKIIMIYYYKLPDNCVLVDDEKILALVIKDYDQLTPSDFLKKNNIKISFDISTSLEQLTINLDKNYNPYDFYRLPLKERYNKNEVAIDGFFSNRCYNDISKKNERAIYFKITPMLEIGGTTVPLCYLQEEQKSTILFPQYNILFFEEGKCHALVKGECNVFYEK